MKTKQANIRSYKKGDVIFSEDDIHSKIGIILNGIVYTQKLYPNGKIIILSQRTSVDLVGEDLVFSDCRPCDGEQIISGGSCEVLFISSSDFRSILFSHEVIMMNFLEYLSKNTLYLKHRLGVLTYSSIQSKIAAYVYSECKRNNTDTITIHSTKSDLAKFLDVSRPSLVRELSKLEKQKIIRINSAQINVLDMDRLLLLLIQKS